MACEFVRGDANGQAQPLQKVFSILAYSPVVSSRDHNGGNRLQALHQLLCFLEASQVGEA